jgi:hypothetical protein
MFGVSFDYLNPRVLDAIRALRSRVFRTQSPTNAAILRVAVETGIEAGVGPATIARQLVTSTELDEQRLRNIADFRAALQSGRWRRIKRYALRHKRLDAMLAKGVVLTEKQVEYYAERYRQRVVRNVAETNARTAALDATKLGQKLSWDDAIAKGVVDRGNLMKRWSSAGDSRTRSDHMAMHNEVRQFDEPFSNGEMVPGESTFNCRCIASYFLSPRRP